MTLIQKMLIVFLASVAMTVYVRAESVQTGSITISNATARATMAGQKNAAGFLTIENNGNDDILLSASSNVATATEIHEMKMDGNVMQMRPVESLSIPAKSKLELQPGGYHLMFMGLKEPLKDGSIVEVQLRFQKAGSVSVKLPIQKMHAMKH